MLKNYRHWSMCWVVGRTESRSDCVGCGCIGGRLADWLGSNGNVSEFLFLSISLVHSNYIINFLIIKSYTSHAQMDFHRHSYSGPVVRRENSLAQGHQTVLQGGGYWCSNFCSDGLEGKSWWNWWQSLLLLPCWA